MAGPTPSNESIPRRSMRFALGITLTFSLTQLIGWPLALIAPVFTLVLLVEAKPLPVRQVLAILGTAFVALVSGYLISLWLLPYPALLVLTACLLMYRFFTFALTAGAHLIAIAAVLLGYILIPVLVKMLPELAIIAGIGILINLVVSLLCAWIMFLLIPAPPAPPAHHHGGMEPAEASTLARTMILVSAPLLTCFLLFGWTSILVLVYGTLLATALSTEESTKMGWKFVIANLMIGGIGMYIFYEALVAVPNTIFMMVFTCAIMFLYGSRIFSDSPKAAWWFSGTIGLLFLVGGALPSDKVIPAAKIFDRVAQIGLASIYVVFAYRVIDLVKWMFSKMGRKMSTPNNC